MIQFRTLRPDEIDIRVGQIVNTEYKHGATLLLYKNARVDMDILDETVGAENWQRGQLEIKGNLYCNVSIYDKDKSEWVTKQDCGVESNTEAEKGEASDAFKRACVNWSIGRELYKSPKIFIKWEVDEKNGKKSLKYNPSFYVKDIDYSERREIVKLIIVAVSGGKETVVFDWQAGKAASTPQTADKPTNTQPPQNSPQNANNGGIEGTAMTLEEALDYKVTFGKQAGIPFKNVPEYYLQWLCENAKVPTTKIAAKLVLEDIKKNKAEVGVFDDAEQLPF